MKSPKQLREEIMKVTKKGKYEIEKISVLVYHYEEDNWQVTIELTTDAWDENSFSIQVSEHGEDVDSAEFKAHRICKQLKEFDMSYEVAV